MVERTEALLLQAGIVQLGPDGQPTRVHSSSWRAGAVRSAKDANVSDAVIMSWGRWSSIAWTNYLSRAVNDLYKAAVAAWQFHTTPGSNPAPDVSMGQSARSARDAANLPAEADHFGRFLSSRLIPRSADIDDAGEPVVSCSLNRQAIG